MGEQTAIAWTDHTFNHIWGCTRVSEACDHCYAEAFAKRTGHDVWGKDGERRFFGGKHWKEPLTWDRKAAERGVTEKVFCASMADVFEPHRDPRVAAERDRLWELIEATPNLIWQLLTKRPEQVNWLAPHRWTTGGWPGNVWLGTTVEHQQAADLRIPRLLAVKGDPVVRFLSCEPLLSAVDFRKWGSGIGWLICGGESGPGHRLLDLDHARGLRDQCAEAGVPFFFKQVGGRTPTAGGDALDGQVIKEFPSPANPTPIINAANAPSNRVDVNPRGEYRDQ